MSLQDYKDEEEEKKQIEEEKKKLAEEEKTTDKEASGKEDAGNAKETKNPTKMKKTEEDMEDDLEDENSFGHKLRLSLDELLDYKSGILIYEIQEANLSKDDVYLQFYSEIKDTLTTSPEKLKEE